MNLIGDPWIPVVSPNGEAELVGLDEIYRRGGEIRDLAVNPPQRVAIMRLLLCITQVALNGPVDEEKWRTCRDQIIPTSRTYLQQRKEKFDLFGRTPFLQTPNLKPTNNALIDKLDFGLSSGNNPVLFDHSATAEGRDHSPAWQALMLLTYQCFSPGGLIGQSEWGGYGTTKSSEHAPCLEGSPLHFLLRGRCLLDTIHANLITRQQVASLPSGQWGLPVWDSLPSSIKDPGVAGLTSSYLGRLVPISRAILLDPGSNRMTLANGLSYAKLPAARDPMLTVVLKRSVSSEEPAYLPIDLQRHPWRELNSVLSLKRRELTGGPLALLHLRTIASESLDLWTGGLAASKAKLLDTSEWTFNLPTDMIGDLKLANYQKGVELAQQGEKALAFATGAYCEEMKITNTGGIRQKTDWINRAKLAYWGKLDMRYEELIQAACGVESNLENWRKLIYGEMHEAFRATCPHETPRQIQAYAQGEHKLRLRRLDSN